MSSIKDVSKAAGVSVATVSRVMNKSGNVSGETYASVMKAVKELNYQPNLLGRNLRRTETKMILVLLPTIANPFYSKIVKGIEDVANKNSYNIMLCCTDSLISRERIYLELLKNRLSDGVIFLAPQLDKDELSEIAGSYPAVQCCEYKEGAKASHISIDNMKAAYTATIHLIGLGHIRIGMISGNKDFLSVKMREEGYKKALEDSNIPYDKDLIKWGDYGFRSGLRAAKSFLDMSNKPSAIFAISDIMAIGALRAIKESGLKVPDDIAVIGFDDISFASMCDPMLTTIAQPKYDLGCLGMELLLDVIKGQIKSPESISLEYELVIRESTVKMKGSLK